MSRLGCSAMLAAVIVALGAAARGGAAPVAQPEAEQPATRFAYVEVFVDSGTRALAAYQIELKPTEGAGVVQIVGIEGGEPAEFRDAPYYDPAAMMNSRVIIAALSTAEAGALPAGKNRLARLHVRYSGAAKPALVASVETASGPEGEAVTVKVELIVEEPK